MSNHYLKILTYHKMTWIEENEMDILTAVVYSDQDKYHHSPGNGLPSDVVFFAVAMNDIVSFGRLEV